MFISQRFSILSFLLVLICLPACDSSKKSSQQSVARQWNEVLLDAIRNDFARPTVHARNLFHFSSASYDAWVALSGEGNTYLLGNTVGDFECKLQSEDLIKSRSNIDKAISYVNFRLLEHRFKFSPGYFLIKRQAEDLMEKFSYDVDITSLDYSKGNAAALGNYIANCYINFGLQDGSNESASYSNQNYEPINTLPIEPDVSGNPDIEDMNHWQVISLENAIDQAGNPVTSAPPFLSPEWGRVIPFALKDSDKTIYSRDAFDYPVYFDPGLPPLMSSDGSNSDDYKWTFAMVAIWSSHLSSADDTMIDISPKSLGNQNINHFPQSFSEHSTFYDFLNGGDSSQGYATNPITNKPYEKQMVKRGDYTRVLAEFWADGPDSETPPGHWFVILNTVNDHPSLKRKFAGKGEELSRLEWDIKSYFILGGAMHDAAIAAWGVKGWYDYIRPISAIRAMAELGQSSNAALIDSYHAKGLPLQEAYIEVVEPTDNAYLRGDADENVGKAIKLYAWRGPDYINNSLSDEAGVGWILAKDWWPYQRPTFVTPPFAGYVSGHSTYSRAAAEVLTALTGSAFFPGGMSQFEVKKNEFLVFEEGPSTDMTLQWATYRDASDQCSLSRIWGGIHPPADDIPGRLMGEQIGKQAFKFAHSYFN